MVTVQERTGFTHTNKIHVYTTLATGGPDMRVHAVSYTHLLSKLFLDILHSICEFIPSVFFLYYLLNINLLNTFH